MDGKPGLGLSAFACLLTVIGLAIPYWMYMSTDSPNGSISAYFGIWKVCMPISESDHVCADFTNVSGVLAAVRALEIIAFLLMVASAAWAAFKVFKSPETMHYTKISGALAIAAGVFAIIGCILFATDSDIKTLVEGMNLHAGFALCIIGGVASLAAGGVYLIASPSAL